MAHREVLFSNSWALARHQAKRKDLQIPGLNMSAIGADV